jgi:hypothetical protein
MATRRERVVLDLEDNFSAGVVRAAAATQLLDKSLDHLSGSSVTSARDLDRQSKSVDRVGNSSRRAAPEVDHMSGRLRIFADAALTLGPAVIRLGAGALPALTASLAGLGAAAGGIGVAVLAFKGLGDGLKALDKYNLEPTAENLTALRIEMEKLGPAGAHFANFLDDLEPKLHNLQALARAGLFPGVEDGINSLLTRLPQVRRIIFDLADGMGNLAREAGEGLAGPKFNAFFDYIESDARPTLEAFAHAAGNVAEGVANLFVAFAPLNRDFTHGLEGATEAFAKWSRGLDQNDSFQHFLDYVRESGPQVMDLLAALASALGGLVHAAAPFGKAVLPALTAVAKVFAAISNSSIGPALYTAAAAMTLFNRASRGFISAGTAMEGSLSRLGSKAETTRAKLSLLGAKGGVVFAGAAAVAALSDSINRIDTSKLDSSLTALQFGDVTPTIDKVVESLDQLESKWNAIDLGKIVHLGGLLGDSSLQRYAQNIDEVDHALADMVNSGESEKAAELFQRLTDLAKAKGIDPSALKGRFDDYAQALHNVANETAAATGATNPFGAAVRVLKGELQDARQSAADLSAALSSLNGWLDKREAIRNYRDSIKELDKALKNGFKPKDAEKIDAVGRNIAQVAASIKDKGLQQDFLAGARKSLEELANKSGPKAKAQVEKLIGALDRYGLTKPDSQAGRRRQARAKQGPRPTRLLPGPVRSVQSSGPTTGPHGPR